MEPIPIRAARAGLLTSIGAAVGKGRAAPARRWAIAAALAAGCRALDGAAAGDRLDVTALPGLRPLDDWLAIGLKPALIP